MYKLLMWMIVWLIDKIIITGIAVLAVLLIVTIFMAVLQGCENPDDEMMYDRKDTKAIHPDSLYFQERERRQEKEWKQHCCCCICDWCREYYDRWGVSISCKDHPWGSETGHVRYCNETAQELTDREIRGENSN